METKNQQKQSIKMKNDIKYHCPMACEGDKVYDKSGKCPLCEIDLELVEENITDKRGCYCC